MQLDQTPLVFIDEMNEYETARDLARHIWSQTFPHAEGLEQEPAWQAFHSGIVARKALADDVKGQPVGGRDSVPVAVGDVLIVFDRTGRNKKNKHYVTTRHTQKEIVGHGGALVKVVKVSSTGKSIDVVSLNRPSGYWQTDLSTLERSYDQTPERYILDSNSRELGRLGTYEEIVERLRNHPSYGDWEAAYRAARAVFEADEAERDAVYAARHKKIEALKVHVETVNRHTHMRLLEISYDDRVQACESFLRKQGTLGVFIAGLAATGHMTTEGSLQVADALKALKL